MHKHAAHVLSVAVLAVSLLTVSVLLHAATSNRQADVVQTSQGELRLTPLYHGSVMLEWGGRVIHVDPWSQGDYTGIPQADMFVVTHTHRDHLDPVMIDKLKKPGTIIVRPPGSCRAIALRLELQRNKVSSVQTSIDDAVAAKFPRV